MKSWFLEMTNMPDRIAQKIEIHHEAIKNDYSKNQFLEPLTSLFFHTFFLLMYWVFSRVIDKLHVQQNVFFSKLIFPNAVFESKTNFLIFAGLLFLFIVTFKLDWKKITPQKEFKVFPFFLIGILIWTHALYPYNFYYDQIHFIDRLLLIGGGVLFFKKPAFIFPFLFQVLIINMQFDFTFTQSGVSGEWTNRVIFFQLMIVMAVWIGIRRFVELKPTSLILLFTILILAHYYYAGFAKVAISPNHFDWVLQNDLGNLIISSYELGWSYFWDNPKEVLDVYQAIKPIIVILTATTLFIEIAACITIICGYNFFIGSAILRIILHVGIFLSTGVFFWNWILLGLALVLQFHFLTKKERAKIFIPINKIISFVVIVFFSTLFFPKSLGWFDTKIVDKYDIIGIIDCNPVFIPDSFFAPYDLDVAQSVFHQINERPILTYCYGSSLTYDIYGDLENLTEQSDSIIVSYTNKNGKNYFQEEKPDYFKKFFQEFIKNKKDYLQGQNNNWIIKSLSFLSPPLHIYTSKYSPAFKPKFLDSINVTYELIYFDEKEIRLLDSLSILQFPLK